MQIEESLKPKAFVYADSFEMSDVMSDLERHLDGCDVIITDKTWKEIKEDKPFLYYKNAYIRYPNPLGIIKFHHNNPSLSILVIENDVVSINSSFPIQYPMYFSFKSYLYQPKIIPSPILLNLSGDQDSLKLSVRSILQNTEEDQPFVLVASQGRRDLIEEVISRRSNTQAVETENNLGEAAANFGIKFYNHDKVIVFGGAYILPQKTKHLYPFWAQQFTYRAQKAEHVSFKTCLHNVSYTLEDTLYKVDAPLEEAQWNQLELSPYHHNPFINSGRVINSRKHLRNIFLEQEGYSLPPINYERVTYPNIEGYSCKDLPTTSKTISRWQQGKDYKTGEVKYIDLKLGYNDWYPQEIDEKKSNIYSNK